MPSQEEMKDTYDKVVKICKIIGLKNPSLYIKTIPNLKSNPVIVHKFNDKRLFMKILINKKYKKDDIEESLAHELGYLKFKEDHSTIYSILRTMLYPLVKLKEKYHVKPPLAFFIYPPYFMYEFAANWEATKRGLKANL